MNQTNWFKKWL